MKERKFVKNCLANLNPKLAAEWHPTKNGDLMPFDVTANSTKKVWWYYPYDDPNTGKHFDFEWQATVNCRSKGNGCPFLTGKAVWKGYNDLGTVNPELAAEWHPTRNGDLTPSNVTANSHKKVWWYYPYDDPNTGKHFDFEWQATVGKRSKGTGCPFITGKAVWKGYNDLQTVNPELAAEWHPTKNGDLTPFDVTASSEKKVWWYYPYDDPNTGKRFDFEWQANVSDRSKGNGCPFLTGKAVWKGYNDLQTVNPELAAEWHPTRNGNLTPSNVTANSGKKVWWYYPYDDPNTGKHFDFEWQANVSGRSKGNGCPFLTGKAVWKGYNDLQTVNPGLAAEWHPTKNGKLTPYDVTIGSEKKVWWLLPYDDPKTEKHFIFEWQASISNRHNGTGCPFLSGKEVYKGFNDLETLSPELARQWHPTRNGDLMPSDVTANSHKKVWWYYPYDDSNTGKHFGFEWQANVNNRSKGKDCPFLTGKAVWKGYNDLQTVNPELAAEWHPTKNGDLTPFDVTASSEKKVWWYYPYDDPYTGKRFDFEWQANVSDRSKGNGCPFLTGKAVRKGYNDLQTVNPGLAAEWHPTRNGDLTPSDVTANSNKKVWWYYLYDDLNTGKQFDFEWEATLNCRSNGAGCPFLTGKAVRKGYNDLQTVNPGLAAEWHPTRNGDLTPSDVTANSNKKVWWYYPYDDPNTGKHFGFEWQANVNNRSKGRGCPFLTGKAVWKGYNDLQTVNPGLAAEWHPTRNGDLTPSDVTANSGKKVWWYYPYDDPNTGKHFDFEWQATLNYRSKGIVCPFLTGKAVWKGYNDLQTVNPGLAAEWHPTKNGDLTPFDVTANSGKKVWWYYPYDDPNTGKHFDFEWQANVNNRSNGNGCPFLAGKAVWKGYNDLQTVNPELAAEWHPTKNRKISPFDLTVNSKKKVWWQCPSCRKVWRSSISMRHWGASCKCKDT